MARDTASFTLIPAGEGTMMTFGPDPWPGPTFGSPPPSSPMAMVAESAADPIQIPFAEREADCSLTKVVVAPKDEPVGVTKSRPSDRRAEMLPDAPPVRPRSKIERAIRQIVSRRFASSLTLLFP